MAGDGEPHPDADGIFCTHKRFEHLVADILIDPVAMIDHADLQKFTLAAFFDDAGFYGDRVIAGGTWIVGLPCIDQNFGENLFNDFVIGIDDLVAVGIVNRDRDEQMVIAAETGDAALEERLAVCSDKRRAGVDDERAELLDDFYDALHGIIDVLNVAFNLCGLVVVGLDEVEVTDDDSEQIVQIMGDALSDGADGGGLAGLFEAAGEIDDLAVDGDEPQLRLDASEGFIEVEWFGDIIDRANAEAFEFTFFGGAGGDEDDRNAAGFVIRLQTLADLEAIHIWHHEIEQDKVRPVFFNTLEGFDASMSGEYADTLTLQFSSEKQYVDGLVIDDQNRRGSHD